MTFRTKQLFSCYFMGVAVLCLTYALMPFIPEITWQLKEVNIHVRRTAFERAASQFRVKQVILASRDTARVPEVIAAEVKPVEIRNTTNQSSIDLDPSVSELLKTVSVPVPAPKTQATSASHASQAVTKTSVLSKPVTTAIPKTNGGTARPTSGIKVALAAEQPKTESVKTTKETGSKKTKGNSIIIPSIKVDMPVFEGDEKVLDMGAWLMPLSADPGEGNTVISGHRYQSFGSKSFYHLDKVKAADSISVWWNGREYHYRVTSNVVVKPDQVDVLNKSSKSKLTIVTCDPVFSTQNRRVVVAEFIE